MSEFIYFFLKTIIFCVILLLLLLYIISYLQQIQSACYAESYIIYKYFHNV